MLERESVNYL
jgi:hypothetical protein